MAVNIDVNSVYNGQGFNQFRDDAKKEQQELLRQYQAQQREAERLAKLKVKLEHDAAREQERAAKALAKLQQDDQREADRAIKAKFDARRREAQQNIRLERDIARAERQQEQELKQSIRDRQRLLQLSAKLERDITKEQRDQEQALKDQISQRRRLNSLTKKLDGELAREQGGGSEGGGGGDSLLAAAGFGGGVGAALSAGAGKIIDEAAAIADYAVEAEAMGREAQGAHERLEALLGSTDRYNDLIKKAQAETRGMITETQAAQAAFLLLESGLAKNDDETAKLIKTMQTLVPVFEAQGASDEKFLRLLSSGNQALIDNFNLTNEQINARKAQIETTKGLTGQEARLAAIKELLIEKADELQGAISDEELAAKNLDRAMTDLETTVGENLLPAFALFREVATGTLTDLNEDIKDLSGSLSGLNDSINWLRAVNLVAQGNKAAANEAAKENDSWGESLRVATDYASGLTAVINPLGTALEFIGEHTGEFLGEKLGALVGDFEAVKGKYEELNKAPDPLESPDDQGIDEEAQKRLDDEEKRLERVRDIRRNAAREILDIDKKATEDNADTWDKYFDDEANAWKKSQDAIAKSRKDFNKDIAKIDRDLSNDLAKLSKDTDKDIEKLKSDKRRDDKNERRRQQIDALADQRLFDFELRQLAADGEALAIQQALERRAIEEDIAKDEAAVENDIEDQKLNDEISRRREAANEKRSELEADAAEARDLRQQELADQEAEEEQSYNDRIEQLREYRDEKLTNIDESRNEALDKLTEELAQSKDLTAQNLEELKPVVAKIGEQTGYDYGAAFSEGLAAALEKEKGLDDLLGGAYFGGRDFGQTSAKGTPNDLASFDAGGIVPGPVGQPQLAIVHGGELVQTPEQQRSGSGITINMPVTVSGGDEARIVAIVERHQQALVRDLEEMLN